VTRASVRHSIVTARRPVGSIALQRHHAGAKITTWLFAATILVTAASHLGNKRMAFLDR